MYPHRTTITFISSDNTHIDGTTLSLTRVLISLTAQVHTDAEAAIGTADGGQANVNLAATAVATAAAAAVPPTITQDNDRFDPFDPFN